MTVHWIRDSEGHCSEDRCGAWHGPSRWVLKIQIGNWSFRLCPKHAFELIAQMSAEARKAA